MAFLGPSLRRTKVLDRPVRRGAVAAVISLAVNAGLLLLLALAGAFEVPKAIDAEKVELAQLTDSEWDANRAVLDVPQLAPVPGPEEKPVVPPPPPPPPKKEEKPGPVVDTGPANDRAPDSARHASERDNRVEKETRSRWQGSGSFRNRAPVPTVGDTARKRGGEWGSAAETRKAREGQRGTNEKGGKPVPPSPPAPAEDRLALLDPAMPSTRQRQRARLGSEGDATGIPGLPGDPQDARTKSGDARLQPSAEDMARITAGPSLDYLGPDIEAGDATALNTESYRFASFFNRMRTDVGDHWHPGVSREIEARDPRGMYGRNDRITAVRIVLDASGALKKIEVVVPSGLDFLDDAAVKSVRDASPFYNMPAGLLDGAGEYSFVATFRVSGRSLAPLSRGAAASPRPFP